MDNNILKLNFHFLQLVRARINPHWVVIKKGFVKSDFGFHHWVKKTTLFDLLVRAAGIAHQRAPSQFKIPQVVGMVHDAGSIGVDIQGSVENSMPDKPGDSIFRVTFIIVKNDGIERFGLHFTFP